MLIFHSYVKLPQGTTHLVSRFFWNRLKQVYQPHLCVFCITSILYFWGIHEELPPYAWKKCAWGKADIPPVTEWQTNISNSWTMNSVPGPAAIGTCNRYNVVVFLFPDIYIKLYIYISCVLCPLRCSVNVPPGSTAPLRLSWPCH